MSNVRNNSLLQFQTRMTLWHIFATVSGGGGIVKGINGAQVFNFYGVQTPAVLGDVWHHKVYLHRGTYEIKMVYLKTTVSGILTLGLYDPTNLSAFALVIGSYDLYAASTATNQELTISSIVVPYDGLFHLDGRMNSKHASSSGYQAWLTCLELYRISD